jgi:hypothetical protein
MNLNPHRPWITPLVIGTFVLMAITGILMFFHLDSGLNKTAHEWLGWAMVASVFLHLLLNMGAFKRYFTQPTGRLVMLACASVLVFSFVPLGNSGGKPPFVLPMQALAKAPLSTVAQVARISTTELRTKLNSTGITSESDSQTIQELVGADLGDQMRTLSKVFGG